MRVRPLTLALLACLAAQTASAQPATTDPRWHPWLGCWAADTTSAISRTVSPNTTCVIPVTGTRDVDLLTIVRGAVVKRDRLDANGAPHPIDGQGCKGTERVNWSSTGHRLFLQSTYACEGGTAGSSRTIYALSRDGELMRVEQVKSGDGSIALSDRMRSVRAPATLPRDAVQAIERLQAAV